MASMTTPANSTGDLSRLGKGTQNPNSSSMTVSSNVQDLLQEKASLESEIAMLRMERDALAMEVAQLKEARHSATNTDRCPEDENSDTGNDLVDCSDKSHSPPQNFICPLTLEIMSVPMQHKETKHNFERKAILEWIYFGKATCPLTRKKLHPEEFVENVALRRQIDDCHFFRWLV